MSDIDLFDVMKQELVPQGTKPLVRLFLKGSAYFDAEFVMTAVKLLQSRVQMASAGVYTLNELEILASHVLIDSAYIPDNMRKGEEPKCQNSC